MEVLSDDYYLWRSLIAMAHVDGRLMREETNYLEENIKARAPDKYHSKLLAEIRSELFSPKPAEKFFRKIRKSSQKVALLELANDLFLVDNHIDIKERNELDKLINLIKNDATAMQILSQEMLLWDQKENTKILKTYVEHVLHEKQKEKKDRASVLFLILLLMMLGAAVYLLFFKV